MRRLGRRQHQNLPSPPRSVWKVLSRSKARGWPPEERRLFADVTPPRSPAIEEGGQLSGSQEIRLRSQRQQGYSLSQMATKACRGTMTPRNAERPLLEGRESR